MIQAALFKAYEESLADNCRMRYITEKGNVIKGAEIYNARDQAIIASIHAVRL